MGTKSKGMSVELLFMVSVGEGQAVSHSRISISDGFPWRSGDPPQHAGHERKLACLLGLSPPLQLWRLPRCALL